MNTKKSSVAIIIILLILIISGGVGFYFWTNKPSNQKTQDQQETPHQRNPNKNHKARPPKRNPKYIIIPEKTIENSNQTQNYLNTNTENSNFTFTPQTTIENPNQTKNNSNSNIVKPKFTITQANFDKVKEYVFSESDDQTLLPNELSDDEKNEIKKIKESQKQDLQDCKSQIDNCQKGFNIYQKEFDQIKTSYESLMPRYVELRIAFDHLNNQINLKTEKWRSLPSSTEKNELYNEIKSIENKRDDLIGELSILEGKLEQIPEHQRTIEEAETNRLGVFKYLKDEEKRIKNKEKEIKEKILSQLKSLYKII